MKISHQDPSRQVPDLNGASLRGASLDGAAAVMSSLCLVHCLLLPLALVLAPMLAVGVAHDLLHGPLWLHWLLIAMAAPVSIYALWRGVGVHHSHLPWALAALGFALMAAGAYAHGLGPVESVLTVVGGLVVALAHWRNWKARQAR